MKFEGGLNTASRTVNSKRNIGSGLFSQGIQTILGFVSRTIFIKYLAVEYLGVNGLFTSILSVLALAELGVGSAFVYSLYKPLAEKKEAIIAGILNLYKKVYAIIGLSVFILGIAVIPFLDQIIPEKPIAIIENITVIYLFFLFNAASSYFFSYKVSLLNADQRNYITTIVYLIFFILKNVIQITVLVVYQDFLMYLATQLILQFLSNVFISIIVDKYYPFLKIYKNQKVDKVIKKEIISNSKAQAIISFGGVMVNSTDNLIINHFSGLVLVGIASNYNLLIGISSAIIIQIFSNLTSSIAQVNAIESKEKQFEIFNLINLLSFWIYGVSAICFVILSNDIILMWIGEDYLLPTSISLLIAINFFMIGMQSSIWTFKTSYGFFNQGKYLVVLTAFINLVLSFWLGSLYGLFGILLATGIARILTNFWYDPYIVFKLGLKRNPFLYLKKFLIFVMALTVSGIITYMLTQLLNFSLIFNLITKLLLCLTIPCIIFYIIYSATEEFKKAKELFFDSILIVISKFKKT
jgi:O-antigen/teichoic acid export membrane protein